MSEYTDAVTEGLRGLTAVSTGACPGCSECMERDGYTSAEEHKEAWHRGETDNDSNFSWSPCGICGTQLGGGRERWHAIRGNDGDNLKGREILHFNNACLDCVYYIAYDTEPESWRRR